MPSIHYPTAFCPVHGFFEARAIGFATDITIINVLTNCPICGRDAEIVTGHYEAVLGNINLAVDPSASPDLLRALKEVAERLQRSEISAEKAVEQATAIDPRFGRLLSAAVSIGAWAIPVVISIVALYLTLKDMDDNKANTGEIIAALERQTAVIERLSTAMDHQGADRPAAEGSGEADPQSKAKPTAENPKPNRRQVVNRARRDRIKARKSDFGGARRH